MKAKFKASSGNVAVIRLVAIGPAAIGVDVSWRYSPSKADMAECDARIKAATSSHCVSAQINDPHERMVVMLRAVQTGKIEVPSRN